MQPEFSGAWLNLGNTLKEQKKLTEAISSYKRAIKIQADFVDAYFNLGNVLKEQDSLEESKACYLKAIEVKPDFAYSYFGLAMIFNEERSVKKAIVSYRKAIELKPDFAEAHLNLGNILKQQGHIEGAAASYRRAIEIQADFADAYYNLGNLLKGQEQLDEAVKCFRMAIEVNPNFVDALSELGEQLAKRGEYEDAIYFYKSALGNDPMHVNSSTGLGWCFVKSGKSNEAINYYSQLLKSFPSNADALFFLFEICRGHLSEKLNTDFSYVDYFLSSSLRLMNISRIVAFGDSHVLLFNGHDQIEVNHVGASTAYNLVKETSSTCGRQQVLNRIQHLDPDDDAVLLCFGEVDIRANIMKYCYQKKITIDECVDDVCARYMAFASEIASKGFKVFVYGGYGSGVDRTSFGSSRERGYASKCLNARLVELCRNKSFAYFSLHDIFFDANSLLTDDACLSDGFHLYCDTDGSREHIHLLLFERMHSAVKDIVPISTEFKLPQLVLGNLGTSSALQKGHLLSGELIWDNKINLLESVVFDLGFFVWLESITVEFYENLLIDELNLMVDGRVIEVQVTQEAPYRWLLNPSDQSVSVIGRYPMLKAPSAVLLALRAISFNENSLIGLDPNATESEFTSTK
jgi:tetratricopeptide (TPR) repeat protein